MAKTLHFANRSADQAAGVTRYNKAAITTEVNEASEVLAQISSRVSGTFSNLYVKVLTNDRAASTVRFRVNGANGNQVITVTGSTTGEFEDTSNTDAVVSGDEFNFSTVVGSGGTTFIIITYGVLFDGPGTYAWYENLGPGISTNSVTEYIGIGGLSNLGATESAKQLRFKTAGTLSGLHVYVETNGRTTDTVFRSRNNAANGNQIVTVAGSTTGYLVDNTNTDAVAVDDLVNLSVTTLTGGGTLAATVCGASFETTNNTQQLMTVSFAGASVAAALTRYIPIAGRFDTSATESDYRWDANLAATASKMEIHISANTVTADSTLRLRIDGANGNQVATITASTTGRFADASNTDAITAANEINYSLVTGATGTSLTIESVTMLLETAAAAASNARRFLLLGVGI